MKAKTMRYALGLVSFLIASAAGAQNNYSLGPVESQNSKTDVVVLGQRFAIDSATRCTYGGKVVSKQGCTAALSRDAYAAVEGDSKILGRAAVITVFPFSYVPGASTVMVGARVTSVSPEIGVVRLGGLLVDNTSLLASGPLSLTVGAYLEIVGTQPASQGVLLADGLRFSTSTITGTGIQTQTITGTGIRTITGTGIQTITGTGIRTITGTGASAITITGTGATADTITGTGRTITDTGATADTITGTGRTITGTGATADTITGTGRTITGTGVTADTITGTGRTITGTGATVDTITGTGRTITGTGATADTITGTGRTITGTGATADTITGTGRTITGTGATANTITGTG